MPGVMRTKMDENQPGDTYELSFLTLSKDEKYLIGGSSTMLANDWNGALRSYETSPVTLNPTRSTLFDAWPQESNTQFQSYAGVSDGKFIPGGNNYKIFCCDDMGCAHIYTIEFIPMANDDRDININWNCGEPRLCHSNVMQVHDKGILSLDVTNSSAKGVTGGMDNSIYVWDLGEFAIRNHYFMAHEHYVTGVRFDEESDNIFYSVSLDGYAMMWDTRQNPPAELIHQNKFGLSCLSSAVKNTLMVGDMGGYFKVFDVRSPKVPLNTTRSYEGKKLSGIFPKEIGNEILVIVTYPEGGIRVKKFNRSLTEVGEVKHSQGCSGPIVWCSQKSIIYGGEAGKITYSTRDKIKNLFLDIY